MKKIVKYILILIFILIVVLAIKTGIWVHNWEEIVHDMTANEASSVVDLNGEVISKIGIERKRENVQYSEIPNNLKNAYVAIEDERFYNHHGIDVKRTLSAIASYVTHFGKASFGASSITQQLVKNLTGDDSTSVSRKVKEWGKAISLEWFMSKEDVLDTYLNIIYVGPNIYGVQTGSKYYFNKNVSELSLEECAFLAGINIAPNTFNPFNKDTDNNEKIKNRTKVVLNKMLELGYITDDEYNGAIANVENGLKFNKGDIKTEEIDVFSYHTDALISEVIKDLSDKKNISQNCATNYLYMANAKIYSTVDLNVQSELEKEFKQQRYSIKSELEDDTSQAAMVIIDNKTGYVVGTVGGLGEKKENRIFNRAVQAIRQTGSSSKPIAVVIPALDKKIVTPVSTYEDEATMFIDYRGEEYSPTDYNGYLGTITLRRAIESSQNIPFVKIMEQLTASVAIDYMEKMGITTLNENDENLSLALGGLDNRNISTRNGWGICYYCK